MEVLSVRMTFQELRAIRQVAASRGQSISDLIRDAVPAYLAGTGETVSVGCPATVTVYEE